ncbi:NADH-quinone oxidoreductase subunit NuoN [Streptacidiphilus fuscans]|uniref:NADH-quinone oxidoreductase subunit N n=1 Tax=Streptacidiphilus fuscans TaxID=2789292 RepID=A0A931FDW4_9ACTN|nr:NADH-quinone oxidoreductase subunit NuoN [Streptacidiphilus fuscans]MBF9068031.1 NADH-quinone oxidoreductase subunit NuoN [Streptacidiphilus fuscans]
MSAHFTTLAAVTTVPPIPAPHIEYWQLSPMLAVFAAALVGVLAEAFVPRRHRYRVQVGIALVGLATAFGLIVTLAAQGYATNKADLAAMGAVAVDGPSLFLQGVIALVAVVAVLGFAERRLEPRSSTGAPVDSFAPQAAAVPGSDPEKRAANSGFATTEVYPLTMFAVGGMLLFPAASDLLTMFVALEVFSLPLYLLCALARRRRLLSQEAAVKYFLLGAFSSAFFLFGLALLYGYAGTVQLGGIAAVVEGRAPVTPALAVSTGNDALLLIGLAMLGVGLLFKVGAVPFHMWTPDVYQGAPTPVTGFMAAATKVAAFGALLRLLYVAFPGLVWDWRPVMWGVAILTMVAGAVIAVTQTDVKRLLAYSSVAHAGFILTGVIATDRAGLSAVLFYLAAYSFVTLGAFAVVTLVRDADGEATHLSRWAGLGRRSPLLAAVFALFLLAFAGIPLTSGFTGKFAVFQAAAGSGATPLVIVGVLSSAVAAFFYIRVIVLMFFSDPRPDGPTVAVPSALTGTAIALGAVVTVVLGVLPEYFLHLANQASLFVR